MAEKLTVTQFNERVNSLVSCSDGIRDVTMVGEISALTTSSAGHLYPTLKDKDSVVKCTLFRYAASRLNFRPEVGMKVTVFGSASYYVKGGSFGFNIESMAPYGKGELQAKLEELTAKLFAEGLFDADRKREPPKYPKTIGVVTSPTGAVIKDIIDTTARRYPVNIILAPATVQGDGASESIVKGIEMLNREDVDVIIVGRGGGSAEDLSAFNSESVVRAIASSKVPVISAVGHATDKSLSDRVADKYAETPTAAAMIATPDKEEEGRNINGLEIRMNRSIENVVDRMRSKFNVVDAKLSPKNAKAEVDAYVQRLKQLELSAGTNLRNTILCYRNKFQGFEMKLDPSRLMERLNANEMTLDDLTGSLDRSIGKAIDKRKNSLDVSTQMLNGLDPKKVLGRGYSFIKDSNGRIMTSVSQIDVGSDITITMKDGCAVAMIKDVRKENVKE